MSLPDSGSEPPKAASITAARPAGFGNRITLKKLLVITVLMFGFGFALVPLYRKICDLTGINVLTKPDDVARVVAASRVDQSRTVTILFDANVQGPWRFHPAQSSLKVHPGALNQMVYDIANQQNSAQVGQAIPSYSPLRAQRYFQKLECFCFKQQALGPHEAKRFPVVFIVDPNLPRDIDSITLSYTFFNIAGATAPAARL